MHIFQVNRTGGVIYTTCLMEDFCKFLGSKGFEGDSKSSEFFKMRRGGETIVCDCVSKRVYISCELATANALVSEYNKSNHNKVYGDAISYVEEKC